MWWRRARPRSILREAARRAFDSVHGSINASGAGADPVQPCREGARRVGIVAEVEALTREAHRRGRGDIDAWPSV